MPHLQWLASCQMYRASPGEGLRFRGMRVSNYERLGVPYKIFFVLERDFQGGCNLLRGRRECPLRALALSDSSGGKCRADDANQAKQYPGNGATLPLLMVRVECPVHWSRRIVAGAVCYCAPPYTASGEAPPFTALLP